MGTGEPMTDSDRLREWALALLVLSHKLRRAADDQQDCCHGNNAWQELDDAAEAVERLGRKIEAFEIDMLREAMRATA